MSRLRIWRSVPMLGLAVALLLPSGCAHKSESTDTAAAVAPSPLPVVETATATLGPIESSLPVTGILQAARDRVATVTPAVSGTLDQLPVHIGNAVLTGQVLAHISPRLLDGQIDQARATLAQSQIQVLQAQENLVQQQAMTKTGISQAQAVVAQAQAKPISWGRKPR